MTVAAEEKIRAFCARHRLKCEWQDLTNLGQRVVVQTQERNHHARILKAARPIREVCVIDWTCNDGGNFCGRIFFYDASAIVHITQAEYDAIGCEFKGVWHDYYGDSPEWEGRRVAMIAGYGTKLFIEGVSLEII